MSIIPTISEASSYTVVGGPGSQVRDDQVFSLILLNRGGSMNRADALEDFGKLHPGEIISIENSGGAWAIESLAAQFPRVRFILPGSPVSPGECVNIGIREAKGRLAAVLWSDMKAAPSGFPEAELRALQEDPPLCTMPWFYNRDNEAMPVLQTPAFQEKKLKVLPGLPAQEVSPTLFPCDYCGIYSREKFLALDGYDPAIRGPWWQKADFGFRARLWGEKIVSSRRFRVGASENAPAENTGAGPDYRAFFLKNLAVRYAGGGAHLSLSAFFPFFLHSGCGFFTAFSEFRAARQWVSRNSSRFKMDPQSIAEHWEEAAE
ncbi:MAG: hypothetical protein LBQ57_06255 [Spirochaetales bacterium]|jgi:hypothetical protein|nr:hypothetical protein [Spirochaetales bacterium]